MSRPYEDVDGASFLRNLARRISVLERGSSKSLIPGSPVEPDHDVDGAQLFLHQGKLFVRIGTISHQLTSGGPEGWGANLLPSAEGSWTQYQPELLGSVANPSGWTASGRYVQLGPVVHVEAQVSVPSAWGRGSGSYQLTLPLTPAGYSSTHRGILAGEFHDGTALWSATGRLESEESVVSVVSRDSGSGLTTLGHTTPWTSGRLILAGTYQVAP